jgi:hypothetical protein
MRVCETEYLRNIRNILRLNPATYPQHSNSRNARNARNIAQHKKESSIGRTSTVNTSPDRGMD